MHLYSSALTHYPPLSQKVLITISTSSGNKPSAEDSSSAKAANFQNAEEPLAGNMPAFACYDTAASMRPHLFTSRAEIIITRPDGVERSVPIHLVKQGSHLDLLGSTTENGSSKKPGLTNHHQSSTREDVSIYESLPGIIRNICRASESKDEEEPVGLCIAINDATTQQQQSSQGSSQSVASKDTSKEEEEDEQQEQEDNQEEYEEDEEEKSFYPIKSKDSTRVPLERQPTEEYEYDKDPVFELKILQDSPPTVVNNKTSSSSSSSSLNDKVSQYLAEVDKQNKYLQDKRRYRFHIIPDGNCLYRAVSKAVYGDQSMHKDLREQTLYHIADHLDEFSPIIEGDVGEFLINAAQDGAWAGYPELLAMTQMLNVNIYLTTGGSLESPTVSTMTHYLGEEDLSKPAIWLSWLSNGHYDVLLDQCLPNPEYDDWYRHTQVQRKRDEELAKSMAASLSRMYIEQNGLH
ncbi:OTU domain-containing protein 1 [Astyanax mexicanus]|uniref:OTU domain-containing protein 1 n=1 Tax=Astyanax mexicanus TaxID=7994 RepID=A0A8T2M2G4_ASTMX|nr:OTU domain-containing protein 1 [Astyanax mexicanus]